MISRVADFLQGESGRRHYGDRGVTHSPLGDRDEPLMITLTGSDRDQGSDERPHHRVAERIGAYGALDHSCHRTEWYALSRQLEQGSDRAGSVPPATESAEIPQPNQGRGLLIQPTKIDLVTHLGDLMAIQRIRRYVAVAQPVNVAPPDRSKPGVESGRRR